MNPRIVVFTGSVAWSVRAGIAAIDAALPDASWLIVVHAQHRSGRVLIRNQWRNLRRNGWRWIPHQIGDVVRGRMHAAPAAIAQGQPGYPASREALAAIRRMKFLTVADIHAESTLASVREFAPDLGLSIAAPILRQALFAIPRLGTLNLHKGKVPEYRGMPPAFWEFWHGDTQVGCTVHEVDAKLDAGRVVAESTVARERFSTVKGMQLVLDRVGIELMRDAVCALLAGDARLRPQASGGQTFRKPTLRQVAQLRARLAPPASLPDQAREIVKDTVLAGANVTANLLLRSLRAPRASVLLYHRVSDDARDNLTVGVEQFERQMALVARRCQAVSLPELLSLTRIPRTSRPLVCVTFDDGYRDNYVHAAPILERHGIAAAFFVSTGMIGTEKPFPHDIRRGNGRLPAMDWEQLRSLHSRGFTLGSHSVNHIDCAAESEDVVAAELAQSMADLRRELSIDGDLVFAYPYGGREHMTPQRLDLVRRAGYAGCLSAFGGSNVARIDPFCVRRAGIHWGFSDQAFFHRCMGFG